MKNVTGRINVSVANLYREPSYGSEIINQGLLGEPLSIDNREEDFTYITLEDGYQGWISNYQWVEETKKPSDTKIIRKHFVHIHQRPDKKSISIRDATIGSAVSVINENENWYEVLLPDNLSGWIEKEAFYDFPAPTRDGAIDLIKEFLGYPYFWGGRSAKGFDCSGLIQTVHSLIGLKLPRDSWMQQRDGKIVSNRPETAEPGDLYFFSDTGSKITHVGMAAGKGRIIHARGRVKENSLLHDETNFSEKLYSSFVDVRTFF